jgi:hypothetical protein
MDRIEAIFSRLHCDRIIRGRTAMARSTTQIGRSAQERLRQIAREQFDAFERREQELRAKERQERAVQLRLPLDIATPQDTSQD